MSMRRRAVTAVLALALAGVPAACGEDDVDKGVDETNYEEWLATRGETA